MKIAIAKYRNHPSVNPITEEIEALRYTQFGFDFTSYKEIAKEVNNLKSRKVFQRNKYPFKNCQGKYRYCSLFPVS